MARRFRDEYGSRPLHLVACAACFALAGWALVQIFGGLHPIEVVIWIGFAAVAHDLVLLPAYTLMGAIAYRGLRVAGGDPLRVAALNHLRIPALASALLLLVWFPLILGLSGSRYLADTGLAADAYLGRWLLITAALFGLSALAFALRVRRARTA